MRFLKRWVQNWIMTAEVYNEPVMMKGPSANTLTTPYEDENVINFRVHSAHGGKIVETTRYDSKSSRERRNLYVIQDSEDFTEALNKIVTLEYLR